MINIEDAMRKEIVMHKINNLIPNFAALGRKYNKDPRTIKKYYEGYSGKPEHRNKKSSLDEYYDIIKEKMSYKGAKVSSLYFFLKDTQNFTGSYSSLTYYIRKHPEIGKGQEKCNGYARYETDIGEMLQFDWVEEITLYNKSGISFTFNVFSCELCYSRLHYFRYSKFKTREDVIICLIDSFKFFGGIPKAALTDNMSSIVDTKTKVFNSEFLAFIKDMNMNAKKCKVRHCFTKGKVEVRNKFMKWLIPYNYEFETEEDLIKIIDKITIEVNNKINSTTQMRPTLLFQKEKEYLQPLPTNEILEHYMNLSVSVNVKNTSLFYYKGSQYSVPPKYINKTLKIKENDNKLYVYHNTELILIHEISDKKINYTKETYVEILKSSMPDKSDLFIEELAERNLNLFDKISNLKKEGVN